MVTLEKIVIGTVAGLALCTTVIFATPFAPIRKAAGDYVGGSVQEAIRGLFQGETTPGQSGTPMEKDFNNSGVPERYLRLPDGRLCFISFDGRPAAEYAGRLGGVTVMGPGRQPCYTAIGGKTAEAFASERR